VETGRTPLLTPGELLELGFALVVSPLTVLFSVVRAARDTLELLRAEGTARDHLDRLVAFDEFTDLVGLPAVLDVERRYGV
jgi:2-methylisocitrate lyase-like PEP mutase family enzyme